MTDTPPKPKRRRWRWLVVGGLLITTAILWLRQEFGSSLTAKASAVRIGQSEDEVLAILGQPRAGSHRSDGQSTLWWGTTEDLGYRLRHQAASLTGIRSLEPRDFSNDLYPVEVHFTDGRVTSARPTIRL